MAQAQTISPREREVLQLITREYTTQEIADQLSISNHTVVSHRKRLLMKVHARNSAGLVMKAIKAGLIVL